jgi:RNA polymerase sigma factor (sigma-70 family)
VSRLSDELLARRAVLGNEHAAAALYERYYPPLYRYCLSILQDESDAQDAVQSTFAAALAGLGERQRDAPLRAWLFRVAHNEAISTFRRRARDQSDELTESQLPEVASAEEQAADRARWTQLTGDLADLPDRQRSALVMRELNGLTHAEIAVVLGTSVGGAKQAIFEAREALTDFAAGRAMQCAEVQRRLSDGDGRVLKGRRMRAHLRDCALCQAFAASISNRTTDLRVIVPVLAPAAALSLFGRSHALMHAGAAADAGSATTAAAGLGAAGKVAGAIAAWKVGVAALAVGTAATIVGLNARPTHRPSRPIASSARLHPAHAAASVRSETDIDQLPPPSAGLTASVARSPRGQSGVTRPQPRGRGGARITARRAGGPRPRAQAVGAGRPVAVAHVGSQSAPATSAPPSATTGAPSPVGAPVDRPDGASTSAPTHGKSAEAPGHTGVRRKGTSQSAAPAAPSSTAPGKSGLGPGAGSAGGDPVTGNGDSDSGGHGHGKGIGHTNPSASGQTGSATTGQGGANTVSQGDGNPHGHGNGVGNGGGTVPEAVIRRRAAPRTGAAPGSPPRSPDSRMGSDIGPDLEGGASLIHRETWSDHGQADNAGPRAGRPRPDTKASRCQCRVLRRSSTPRTDNQTCGVPHTPCDRLRGLAAGPACTRQRHLTVCDYCTNRVRTINTPAVAT